MPKPRMAMFSILVLVLSVTVLAAEFKPGEVIVKYRSGVLRTRSTMNALYETAGTKSVQHYSGIMTGFEQLILNDPIRVEDAIAILRKDKTVEYAQPNYILHVLPIRDESIAALQPHDENKAPCLFARVPFPPGCDDARGEGATPLYTRPKLDNSPVEIDPPVEDPDLGKAYGLRTIKALDAWKITRGSKNFIVADIDTGIDYNHSDLSANLWRNPKPSDKNDIVGFDFVHNDGLPYDDNGHGTHTAGTIGAVGGNGAGISGVSQRLSLMALKFLSADGSGTTADAIRAINYAVTHGAKVLNNSWGGQGEADNLALHDAIDRAKANDVLFVAAAGNEGSDNDGSDPSYPASFQSDNILSVVATDEEENLAYFSNYGKSTTHLAAPGVDIYSTVPGNKYNVESGTSMACPYVAGAAALLWSRHPDWKYFKVKEVLMKTVDILDSLTGKTASGGRLNILQALTSSE